MRDEVTALRRSVGFALRERGVVEVRGPGAWDGLDRALPCDLLLRDGQARPTLLLDDDGSILADVLLVADDDGFLLTVEGLSAEAAAERIRATTGDHDLEVTATDLRVIGVDGPFAWELLSRYDTPGVVGLPYLSSYWSKDRADDGGELIVRAGRTGEYGYDLIVPQRRADTTLARVAELAVGFEGVETGEAAASYCALENFFFDVATERGEGPLELQLQWRLSRRKEFPGSAALAARRAAPRRRVVGFRADETVDGAVTYGGREVGRVLRSAASLHGEGAIGLVVVEDALAHPGHDALAAGGQALRTVSVPFVANRSLYVKPQQHSFAGRHQIAWPSP